MKNIISKLVRSWAELDSKVNSLQEIKDWIEGLNNTTKVNIRRNSLADSDFWFYDDIEGKITNKNHSFFQICGLNVLNKNNIILEQPIIIQDEIGYLGIICKEIDGTIHFLMQAKIEPGNVNKIQISPTIQATKSNFVQKHGGKKPAYLDYFIDSNKHIIIVDQIQSEQSSRFLGKRNRNIIILINEDIDILPSHKWMTLGQIKQLMKIDNIVNMDTRTVLSCIPFSMVDIENDNNIEGLFTDKHLYQSIFGNRDSNQLTNVFHYINNYKMYDKTNVKIVPLYSLNNWSMRNNEFTCNVRNNFKVIFCDISIEGREVKHWTQPLFEATGIAMFGLFVCNDDGAKKFLVHAQPEIGCFDKIELGPTIQLEANYDINDADEVIKLFLCKIGDKNSVKYNVVLSEEGGRFYHEQNRNIILEIKKDELYNIPSGYFWMDYKNLNTLVQVNNCLNIQLRNLLSLLEV